jgi:hypothetical protein
MQDQMPVPRFRRKPSPARHTAMLLLAITHVGAFVLLEPFAARRADGTGPV